jgi:hypothetical protein
MHVIQNVEEKLFEDCIVKLSKIRFFSSDTGGFGVRQTRSHQVAKE